MSAMPRAFVLYRREDVSGVSGTGTVAAGCRFEDGTVVVHWLGEFDSTAVWPGPRGLEHALRVHGHDGATTIVWADEVVGPQPPGAS